MRNVYTVTFINQSGVSGSSNPYIVGPGVVAIVTSGDFYTGGQVLPPVVRIVDINSGVSFFYAQGTPEVATYFQYRGRQAFVTGQGFAATSENGLMDMRVTGYLLAAP